MPAWYYLLAIVIAAVIAVIVHSTTRKRILWAVLSGYLFLIVSSTVLTRTGSSQFEYNLKPFWTYHEIAKGTWRARRFLEEIMLNVVMLLPVGLIVPCLVEKRRFINTLVSGICISLIIEILQLITKRGLFEFDDIIHNAAGVLIGYGIYKTICIVKDSGYKEEK